jgi:hypothetical protein
MTLVGAQVPQTLAIGSMKFNPEGEGGRNIGRNILYKCIYKEEIENVRTSQFKGPRINRL